MPHNHLSTPPSIGWTSLGCPKALVDSERLLTTLKAQGYRFSPNYEAADLVVVNTCGFIESAQSESLEAIGEAIQDNGKVIVIGCLGAKPELILKTHPKVLAVADSRSYKHILSTIHKLLPPPTGFESLLPEKAIKLTPQHYAYLKIAEGCNHHCTFCIIPSLRGPLVSETHTKLMFEAENLVKQGVKELLVIAQDTFAYGTDDPNQGRLLPLIDDLASLGVWVRLHYLYPYPQLDRLVEKMAEGKVVPYLDMPLQHSHPDILKSMKRVHYKNSEGLLKRLEHLRSLCPDLTLRSTFITGFPGENEQHFDHLLDFLAEARIERVGCFPYSDIEGATSKSMTQKVPQIIAEARAQTLMEKQAAWGRSRLEAKLGKTSWVLLDEVQQGQGIGRTPGDAPEVDGLVYLDKVPQGSKAGSLIQARLSRMKNNYDFEGVSLSIASGV